MSSLRYAKGAIDEPQKPFLNTTLDILIAHCVDEHPSVWEILRRSPQWYWALWMPSTNIIRTLLTIIITSIASSTLLYVELHYIWIMTIFSWSAMTSAKFEHVKKGLIEADNSSYLAPTIKYQLPTSLHNVQQHFFCQRQLWLERRGSDAHSYQWFHTIFSPRHRPCSG